MASAYVSIAMKELMLFSTGVISSTLVSIKGDLGRPLDNFDKSYITSCTSLGALIASPIIGLLADRFGRKSMILVADCLFIVGALWQATIGSVAGMIMGRTIVGFAVGGGSLVVPLYISELSPSAIRGKMVTVSVLFITLGQVVAYLVGYALAMKSGGWRWIVGLGAAPAVLQCGLMLFLPESPRWLIKAGKGSKARDILRKVYGTGNEKAVEEVLHAIDTEILAEEAISFDIAAPEAEVSPAWTKRMHTKYRELFHIGSNRRALTIACLLQGLQQLCGFVCFLPLLYW